MVQRMPASKFVKFFKAARMLTAEFRIADIEAASFPHLEKRQDRDDFLRKLTHASREFISEGLTDFSQFAASMAKRLMPNG